MGQYENVVVRIIVQLAASNGVDSVDITNETVWHRLVELGVLKARYPDQDDFVLACS